MGCLLCIHTFCGGQIIMDDCLSEKPRNRCKIRDHSSPGRRGVTFQLLFYVHEGLPRVSLIDENRRIRETPWIRFRVASFGTNKRFHHDASSTSHSQFTVNSTKPSPTFVTPYYAIINVLLYVSSSYLNSNSPSNIQ